MENKELLGTISKRLGVLIALQLSAAPEKTSLTENVQLLVRLGLENPEIADILGTSTNAVNVMKNRIKAKKK